MNRAGEHPVIAASAARRAEELHDDQGDDERPVTTVDHPADDPSSIRHEKG